MTEAYELNLANGFTAVLDYGQMNGAVSRTSFKAQRVVDTARELQGEHAALPEVLRSGRATGC